jgi:hypothetical protein
VSFSISCKNFVSISEQPDFVTIKVRAFAASTQSLNLIKALTAPLPSVKDYNLTLEQRIEAKEAPRKAAQGVFYTAFKNYCELLNVGNNCEKIHICFLTVMDGLAETVNSLNDPTEVIILRYALYGVRQSCMNLMYTDMIQTFASQPAESITPDSFKKQVQDMCKAFPEQDINTILCELLAAILQKHPNYSTDLVQQLGEMPAHFPHVT